jgi:hypothetical protein
MNKAEQLLVLLEDDNIDLNGDQLAGLLKNLLQAFEDDGVDTSKWAGVDITFFREKDGNYEVGLSYETVDNKPRTWYGDIKCHIESNNIVDVEFIDYGG